MSSTRRTSIAAGALFIVATVSVIVAAALLPALSGADYLTGVADHPQQMAGAALLYLIGAGASVGIAIALYPLLRELNTALALGSVVFRTIEAVLYAVGVVLLLSVLTLGQQVGTAPAAGGGPVRAMADSLLSVREHSSLVAVFAFGLGGLMYYVVFYQARLVPRWLSGFGIVAALLTLTGCVIALFSNSDVTGYKPLMAPIFVQELVLAIWLLARGFNPSPPSASVESQTGTPALSATAGPVGRP